MVFSFLTPATTTVGAATAIIQRKAIILSSTSKSFPLKPRKRKNYLRPKLLETLTIPYPNTTLLPQESPLPIESHEILQEISFDQTSGESFTIVVGDDDQTAHQNEAESRQFLLSPTSGPAKVENGEVGKFSTGSLLKLGLYLVGIFVFQTICAVWVLGSADSDQEHEISDSEAKGSQLGANERNKGKILLNFGGKFFGEKIGNKSSHAVYLNESELEEKIVEIRAMAKEARESERKKLKNNGMNSYLEEAGGGDADEDVISSIRSGIQEEVDTRLLKLQKRLNATREKSPLPLVSHLNKFGKVENRVNGDHSDVAELNRTLMFKKKMKFRNAPSMPRNDPKGFQPLENSDISKKKKSSSSTVDTIVDLPAGNSQQNDSSSLEEDCGRNALSKESSSLQNHGKKLEKGREGKKMGGIVNPEFGNVKRRSSERETKNSQSLTKENQNTVTKPNADLSRNGSSNCRKVGSKPVAKGSRDKSSDIKADLWWLHLPCVIAVLMQRGSNHEEQGGLYTLKTTSHESDPIDSSYTVAFEDRGDATNFCYLLESFFEELGDFSADIVPLSIKELHEAVKSDGMKVIVVKKGQLQLYAGQPLADVEMALRSLVE
ncbi:uncharacterized protein LOC117914969 isoform X2 [Vitis riparia]|uniref:uncharacterized protein LOC117914969 isoform X2 n=1 Tax=Vitis riparia TaxID=96939 RepID=UPI00155A7E75|nr:uncharacterized protein LOC117914969 isoform X2 [Vitis riparia]